MKIHHFRNATFVIEANGHFILVDPMLGSKGSMPPFTFFRFKPLKNPIVDLPIISKSLLNKVTHCVITHNHPDHIDKSAEQFLKENKIPVFCSVKDEKTFIKKGLNVSSVIDYWVESKFLEGSIEGIPAQHGYGFVAIPAGNVMGFFIKLPNQPSIYISSDTIYTKEVNKVLTTYSPDISIVAAGSAQFDIFKPLLMTLEDVLKFIKNAPGNVIANHMEAVNHCPTTRVELREKIDNLGYTKKVLIPEDGET